MLNEGPMELDLHEVSPLQLAFLGDGVLELLVRTRLLLQNRKSPGAMHRESAQVVSAHGQFEALSELLPLLSEAEANVVRRGRNANKATVSKNATVQEYRASTGLEALFGWLYLRGENVRIRELFEQIWRHHLEVDGV